MKKTTYLKRIFRLSLSSLSIYYIYIHTHNTCKYAYTCIISTYDLALCQCGDNRRTMFSRFHMHLLHIYFSEIPMKE